MRIEASHPGLRGAGAGLRCRQCDRSAVARGHAVADDLLVQAVDDLVGHARQLPEGRDPGRVLDQVQVQQVEVAVLLGADEDGVDQGGDGLAGVGGAGDCPDCGMALEPQVAAARTEYVCPMHPEIVRAEPGSCPICGMALEPRTVTLADDNPELRDMTRRFAVSAALTVPLLVQTMAEMAGAPITRYLPPHALPWIQLVLATPVVVWGGAPFYVRGWRSIVTRKLNMFTLIAIGIATRLIP